MINLSVPIHVLDNTLLNLHGHKTHRSQDIITFYLTKTGESSSPANVDNGEVSVESKGIVVTLSPRQTCRGAKPYSTEL